MANTIYDNFFLTNEVTDQFNSHLDLQQFCTIDRTLSGTPGMLRKINVYSASSGAEKLAMGEGNSKGIEVSFTPEEYRILLAQNYFAYYDEEQMTDPTAVLTGIRHLGTDLFNLTNKEIFAEFRKAELSVDSATPDFAAFVDAQALLGMENVEGESTFALVHPKDKAKVRKALKDDLKFVESFSKTGYIGSVAGTNLFATNEATEGEIIVATKDAVMLLLKKDIEVEQSQRSFDESNVRKNVVFARTYYLAALRDKTKAVKILLNGASA